MSVHYDLAVIGGGLVGLATADRLLARDPALRLVVLEKERDGALHQSGRNSGVVHSGLYYAPGSLRARLCREGRALLERFAAEHGVPYRRCGKIVVAVEERELPRLTALRARGEANGLVGLCELDRTAMREVEPHVSGLAALHVPETGVIDYRAVASALAREVTRCGGEVLLGFDVRAIARRGDALVLHSAGGDEITAGRLVTCAGLQSDRIARLASPGATPPVRIVPFRGGYWSLAPEAASLIRGLVYPVPDPALPFLGVHFTRTIDGRVLLGPTASLALAREGYGRRALSLRDASAIVASRGTWLFVARHASAAAGEVARTGSRRAMARAARRYVREIALRDLMPGPSGIRAQAMDARGHLLDDFLVAGDERALHVLNAPSPAATACLAIARLVAEQVEERLTASGRPARP